MIPPVIANTLLVLSWLLFSFLFWRILRREGIDEDRIFDLTFYATLVTFIFSRIGFVVLYKELFVQKSPLLLAAIWVTPGLSWLFGLVGGVSALTFLSRQYKVRLGIILDAVAQALPVAILLGLLGTLPHSVYEIGVIMCIGIGVHRLAAYAASNMLAYGIVGIWFFLLYAVCEFVLEFWSTGHVYWGRLTANQWILIGIFAESIGVLYVRGGGREHLRPIINKIYAAISKRHTHRDSKAS